MRLPHNNYDRDTVAQTTDESTAQCSAQASKSFYPAFTESTARASLALEFDARDERAPAIGWLL